MADYTVSNVSFGQDGVRINYMSGTDVRGDGDVYQDHTLALSWAVEDPDILQQMQDLDTAATALLAAGILHWASSKPLDLVAERQKVLDEADDDDGLGG